MKGTGSFIMMLLALWLVWDTPVDIEGNAVDSSLIKEYRVYVDGVLKGTVGPQPAGVPECVECPGIPIVGLGWGNKKQVAIEAVATTGEVSPLSDSLMRLQLKNGGSKPRVEEK